MAVALRLMRFGKKGYPTYRIVALDKRSKRDGAYLENVGTYNPMEQPAKLIINEERLAYWIKVGAVVSEGMRKILKSREPKKVAVKKAPVKAAKEATKKSAAKKATPKAAKAIEAKTESKTEAPKAEVAKTEEVAA